MFNNLEGLVKKDEFDFDKLNRPATYEEGTTKCPPCSGHDKDFVETEERLNKIKSRVFSTGAQRDLSDKKPAIHNLLGYTRIRFGYHMRMGANKYGDGNWLKGLPTDCYLESVDRHLAAYMDGNRDEDHLSAILFGIQGCMLNEKNEGQSADHYFKTEFNDGKEE